MTRAGVVVGFLLLCSGAAGAQAPSTRTLGGVIAGTRAAADSVDLAAQNARVAHNLDSLTMYFVARDTSVSLDEIAAIFTRTHASFADVARLDRDDRSQVADSSYYAALVGLMRIVTFVRTLPAARRVPNQAALFAPADSLQGRVLSRGIAVNQQWLHGFEIKYGPKSPRLNLAEVVLNYAAQLWVPGFTPTAKGPSPLEIVASYRPADLTASQAANADLTARVVSAGQLGLRVYDFDPACGTGVLADLVRPCQSSVGLFALGPRDQALVRTWGPDSRAGLYVSRGAYHVGYVFGSGHRFVFGTSTQILPFVF